MGLSILYVEDNLINQQLAKMVIVNDSLDLADDGQEGIDKFKANQYEVVLMDLNLPIKGGIEATREIRAYEIEHGLDRVPIVAITADWDNKIEEQCNEAGMDTYLIKPFDSDNLTRLYQKLEQLKVKNA